MRESIIAKLKANPTEVRALSELKKYILELPIIIGQMNNKIDHMYDMYEYLDSHLFDFPKEDLYEKWVLKRFSRDVYEIRDKKQIDIENKNKIFFDQLKDEQTIFESAIKDLHESVDNLITLHDPEQFELYAEKIMNIDKDLKISNDKAND